MKSPDKECDVLVVGAGVAGMHAAYAASQKGATVMLMTSSWDTAGAFGWGPRFGEVAMVGHKKLKEGAKSLPVTAISSSLIYGWPSKSGEVALVDGHEYQNAWRYRLEQKKEIKIFQDTCERLTLGRSGWIAETGWGLKVQADAVVLAVGTFLGGRVTSGTATAPGGRPGELGAYGLELSLSRLGIELLERRWLAGPVFAKQSIRQLLREKAASVPESGRPSWLFGGADRRREACLEPINKDCDQYYLRAFGRSSVCSNEGVPSWLAGAKGLKMAQAIKPGFSVLSLGVPRENINEEDFSHKGIPGLFLAGRIIGAGSYAESAYEGLAAGMAAAVSRGT